MERQASTQTINNDFYEELGVGWYNATNHPIALLRAENAVRIPWIIAEIGKKKRVLDIGCGAGFLTNALASIGHQVFGIDISENSLAIAKSHDKTKSVQYKQANAYALPFDSAQFDVVCAMDVLEHVEDPKQLIQEANRVLKVGGKFFFHTFNRNWLSYFLVIKGVEWCVPNVPKNMHVYPLFIKPKELRQMCQENGLDVVKIQGFTPKLLNFSLLKMIFTRKVPSTFRFGFSKNLMTGYCGMAKKR